MMAAHFELDHLSAPIVAEGRLSRDDKGFYSLDGKELRNGQKIEYLFQDMIYCSEVWLPDNIVYRDGEYQLLRRIEIPLEGLLVRILDYTKGGNVFAEALRTRNENYSNQRTGG